MLGKCDTIFVKRKGHQTPIIINKEDLQEGDVIVKDDKSEKPVKKAESLKPKEKRTRKG